MTTKCYTPSVAEIRRYTQEANYATARLMNELENNPVARSYLSLIRVSLFAVLCNLELAGSQLVPPEDRK